MFVCYFFSNKVLKNINKHKSDEILLDWYLLDVLAEIPVPKDGKFVNHINLSCIICSIWILYLYLHP